ncbi:hypothetical protein NGRA_0600 [Nosema granulosis]|uniref:Uncharacterized protein n=1 Tax=Nosema granulosis TaxID=83296 RepID=A0A9P6H124_9MICR|nr:hypothetical protein NGRA_0600 [Nosema granulosis]
MIILAFLPMLLSDVSLPQVTPKSVQAANVEPKSVKSVDDQPKEIRYEVDDDHINIVTDMNVRRVKIYEDKVPGTTKVKHFALGKHLFLKNPTIVNPLDKNKIQEAFYYSLPINRQMTAETIIEFEDIDGNVIFHTIVLREVTKLIIKGFKKGKPTEEENSETVLFTSFNIANVQDAQMYYFAVSEDIYDKISLEKNVELAEFENFLHDLKIPMNKLLKEYLKIFQRIDNSEVKPEIKKEHFDILYNLLKSNVVWYENLVADIRALYHSNMFEHLIVASSTQTGEPDLGMKTIQDLENSIKEETSHIISEITKVHSKVRERGVWYYFSMDTFRRARNSHPSFGIAQEIIDLKDEFLKLWNARTLANSAYVKQRNDEFISIQSKDSEEKESEEVTAFKKLKNDLLLAFKFCLIDVNSTLNDSICILKDDKKTLLEDLNVATIFSDLYTKLSPQQKNLEDFTRISTRIEVFEKNQTLRNVISVLKDPFIKKEGFQDLIDRITSVKGKLQEESKTNVTEGASFKLDVDSANRLIKNLNDTQKSNNSPKNDNTIKSLLNNKLRKHADETKEKNNDKTKTVSTTENFTPSDQEVISPKKKKDNRWFGWISNGWFIALIVSMIVLVAIVVVIVYMKGSSTN